MELSFNVCKFMQEITPIHRKYFINYLRKVGFYEKK